MKVYTCFPGGKAKALTMSYDDGKVQDRRLIDIFNKYGIKGTFNLMYVINEKLNDNLTDQDMFCFHGRDHIFEEMEGLYAGHEIATHTMTHPTIERCPLVEVAQELLEDRKGLEKWTGQIVRGHAYPNGSYSEEIKQLYRQLGVAYARVVETVPAFALPKDPLEWHATCHHNDPKLMEYAEFFANFQKRQYLKLMYVWGHSYEFDNNDNWDVIENFCKYMGGRDDIWYATNIEIIDYMDAAKRLQFSADYEKVYNPNACSVWLQLDSDKCVEIKGGTLVDLNTLL